MIINYAKLFSKDAQYCMHVLKKTTYFNHMQKWKTTEAIKSCDFLLQNLQLLLLPELEVQYVILIPFFSEN